MNPVLGALLRHFQSPGEGSAPLHSGFSLLIAGFSLLISGFSLLITAWVCTVPGDAPCWERRAQGSSFPESNKTLMIYFALSLR